MKTASIHQLTYHTAVVVFPLTEGVTESDVEFLCRVANELASARRKFPTTDCVMTALTEEVGEVAKALLDQSSDRIVDESVQVAAMACRIAVEGDPSHAAYRLRTNAGSHPKVSK